jgi:hypothetical protein
MGGGLLYNNMKRVDAGKLSQELALKEWIEVTDRHIKEFGKEMPYKRYFEEHYLKDGKVVSKCRNTWNCDCPSVTYQAK